MPVSFKLTDPSISGIRLVYGDFYFFFNNIDLNSCGDEHGQGTEENRGMTETRTL